MSTLTPLSWKTDDHVTAFADAMRDKLAVKQPLYGDAYDEDAPTTGLTIRKMLAKNIADQDWVDVANLAMMLWVRENRGK
jgi:hypothetical protein